MASVSPRRMYLDRSPGEARGVVTLHGLPERLFIEREGEVRGPRLGEVWRGRIRRMAPAFVGAFIDLGLEQDAFMKTGGVSARLSEGQAVEAVFVAEPRAGKGAAVSFKALSEGAPERLAAGPTLEERLRAAGGLGAIAQGEAAREAADLAEEAVLEITHAILGGAVLTIERTRALIAIDVDLPNAAASRKGVMDANLDALRHAARLLRLKSLGGIVMIDLIGRPRDLQPIQRVAREAFHADEPGMLYGQVSRSGVFELGKPHREQPVAELLSAPDGRLSARSVAQRLLRRLEREGRADPGARLAAVAAPEIAAVLRPLLPQLGPRFSVIEEAGRDRLNPDIRALA